jgi:predicted RNA-binding Zn ribbon-like protein
MGFFGGHIALDFVNTIDDEGKTRQRSAIPDWRTLIDWSQAAGILDENEAVALAGRVEGVDQAAELQAIHELREAAWRVLSRYAADGHPQRSDLERIEDTIKQARAQARLCQDGRAFNWVVFAGETGIEVVRYRLALQLDELVSYRSLDRLRECGRCTGLFLDHGRGAGRRWCRMETCGNRAKVERHRGKQRGHT